MNLHVIVNGKTVVELNERLVAQQRLGQESIDRIILLHTQKYYILRDMAAHAADNFMLRMLAEMVTLIEFELQRSWGFPLDKRYHRFWDLPGCGCPKMDNKDAVGTKYSVINSTCPIHGHSEVMK